MASEIPQIHVRLKAIPLIDEWADRHGLSRSDAINMMCVSYLEVEKYVRNRGIRFGEQQKRKNDS